MNKNMKYGLAAVLVIAIGYGVFFSGPRSYEDCILANMENASNPVASSIVRATCRAKFPSVEDSISMEEMYQKYGPKK